jgi:hypothetical protein
MMDFLKVIPGYKYLTHIIMVLIPLIILYIFYMKLRNIEFKYRVLLRKIINAKKNIKINRDLVPFPKMGKEYSMMMWIKINDLDYKKGKFKNICYIGDTGSKCQPGIWLSPEKNNLIFRFRTSEILRNYIKHKNKCFRSLGTKVAKENYTMEFGTLGQTLSNGKKITTIKQMKNYIRNLNSTKTCDPNTIQNQSSFVVLSRNEPGDDEVLQKIFYYKKNVPKDVLETRNMEMYGNVKFRYYTFILDKNEASLNPEHKNAVNFNDGIGTILPNIPINKWLHISIVVYEQSVQIYIDGRMVTNVPFTKNIILNKGNLNLCSNGGFGGELTRVIYYGMPLSYTEILKQYVRGPTPWDFDLEKLLSSTLNVSGDTGGKKDDANNCKK